MSWQILSFISVVLFTFLNLLQRKMAVESHYPRAAALIFTLLGGLFALGYSFFSNELAAVQLPSQPIAWVALVLACVCYGFFERVRFFAAKKLEASTFNTLLNSSLIISWIAGITFFNESFTFFKTLGTFLILVGLFLVSFETNLKNIFKSGSLVGLGIGAILGLAWTFDKWAVTYFNPSIYSIFVWTLPCLIIFIPKQSLEELREEWKLGSWKLVVLAGVNVFGYIAQVKAIEKSDLSQVMPIIQTSVLLTVLLSIFLLGEKNRIIAKISAAILAVIGVGLLV